MGLSFSKPDEPRKDSLQDSDIDVRSSAWGGEPNVKALELNETTFPDLFLLGGPILACSVGFLNGASRSGRTASRVFLAENAHRTPSTYQGWYFYNKTKNYHVILKSVQGGLKRGFVYASVTSAFLFTDVVVGTIRTWAQTRASYASRPTANDVPLPSRFHTGHHISQKRRYPMHAEQADSDPASATSNGGTAGMDVDAHMDVDIDRPLYDADQDIALLSSTKVQPSVPKVYPWWSKNAAQERSKSPWRIADGLVAGSLTTLALAYSARLGPRTMRRVTILGTLSGGLWGLSAALRYNQDKWLPHYHRETEQRR